MLCKIVNGAATRHLRRESAQTLMNTSVRRSVLGTCHSIVNRVSWCATLVLAIPSLVFSDSPARFPPAEPGYHYRFPEDHGTHDQFRTEWWYYTGQLTAADGRTFGFQLTFFRRGIPPSEVKTRPSEWSITNLYLAHFALTDVKKGRFLTADKISRAGLGKAGADAGRLHVWIDRWSAADEGGSGTRQRLQASADDFAIELNVKPEKPPVVHGSEGVSRKGAAPGQTSHYYSFTRLDTEGRVRVGTDWYMVSGTSWMDHEFGSADLGKEIVGWDWFSLQLSDHTELMWYQLRRIDGSADPASSGTLVLPDGRSRHLTLSQFSLTPLSSWTSPHSGARYPQGWHIAAQAVGLELDVTALLPDQELQTPHSTQVTYWEGAVAARGTAGGTAISGRGYVELTGYAEQFNHKL
jgi:predicted secreted hydrolase